jgi:hypothetical protein
MNMDSLTLLAGCVWLMNSLHATPDVGRSSRNLIDALFPHVEHARSHDKNQIYQVRRRGGDADEDDNSEDGRDAIGGEDRIDLDALAMRVGPLGASYPPPPARPRSGTVPAAEYGMFFTRPIQFDPNYPVFVLERSPLGHLDSRAFAYFFGTNYQTFAAILFEGTLSAKPNPLRSRNCARPRMGNLPVVPDEALTFDIPGIGTELIDRRSDWSVTAADFQSGDIPASSVTVNQRVHALYHRMFIDIMLNAPNHRNLGEPSYCLIDEEGRMQMGEHSFAEPNLALFFEVAQWKDAKDKDWRIIWNHVFPLTDKPRAKSCQGFLRAPYYKMWMHLVRTYSQETIGTIREIMFKRFRETVVWFPWCKSDRIWKSDKKGFPNRKTSPGLNIPAPHFLTNGKAFFAAVSFASSLMLMILTSVLLASERSS